MPVCVWRCLRVALVACLVLGGDAARKRRGGGGRDESVRELDLPQDQDPRRKIMFWRPQKVGSSTMVNILSTYSFRHGRTLAPKGASNSLCYFLKRCAKELDPDYTSHSLESKKSERGVRGIDKSNSSRHADISFHHHICNEKGDMTQKALPCVFRSNNDLTVPIKQFTLVREPISRAISVYYFWGELYKLKKEKSSKKNKELHWKGIGQILNVNHTYLAPGFVYHGDETSPPPKQLARDFASSFSKVYRRGMPGPSYTWSSFSHSPADASERLYPKSSDFFLTQVFPMVLERLDESLVLLCDYLGWQLADAVFIKPRKHLSSHPKANDWDQSAIMELKKKLSSSGEESFYKSAQEALDMHIKQFNDRYHDENSRISGVTPLSQRTALFQALKAHAEKVCQIDTPVSEYYRKYLSRHPDVRSCPKFNKLREVDYSFIESGHCFHLSPESKLYTLSIDLCGSCEAQAASYALERGMITSVEKAPLYKDLKQSFSNDFRQANLFHNCP